MGCTQTTDSCFSQFWRLASPRSRCQQNSVLGEGSLSDCVEKSQPAESWLPQSPINQNPLACLTRDLHVAKCQGRRIQVWPGLPCLSSPQHSTLRTPPAFSEVLWMLFLPVHQSCPVSFEGSSSSTLPLASICPFDTLSNSVVSKTIKKPSPSQQQTYISQPLN